MQQACEISIDRLVSWSEARLLAPDRDVRQAAEAAGAMAEQFSKLLRFINTWPKKEPTEQQKTDTINSVMRLREQAMNLLARFGATL
jgi:hypothetical protein